MPYAAVIVLGALSLMPAVDSRSRRIVLFHLVGLFVLEAGFAIYHVGVEAHVWQGPITCIGKSAGLSVTDMMSALGQPGHPNCDEPAFILMGISLAGYNVIAAVVLFAASLYAALRKDWWQS